VKKSRFLALEKIFVGVCEKRQGFVWGYDGNDVLLQIIMYLMNNNLILRTL